ncbi:hypothetical protein YSY43_36910 [Paenibacillus sp. YSY-4.3]
MSTYGGERLTEELLSWAGVTSIPIELDIAHAIEIARSTK